MKRAAPDPPTRPPTASKRVRRPRISAPADGDITTITPGGVGSSSRALLEVTYGRLTPGQLIQTASEDPASPLRAITLMELLMAEEKATTKEVDAHLQRLAVAVDEDVRHVRREDVGWLVHTNSGGRRMAAWRAIRARDDRLMGF